MIEFALKVWSFLCSPLARYIGLALALVTVLTLFAAHERGVQHRADQIHEQNAVALVQAKLDQCHANGLALEQSIATQNAAVSQMKSEGDRRAQMLADGLKDARQSRAGAEARAAELLRRPAVGLDACARSEAAREAVLKSLQP